MAIKSTMNMSNYIIYSGGEWHWTQRHNDDSDTRTRTATQQTRLLTYSRH